MFLGSLPSTGNIYIRLKPASKVRLSSLLLIYNFPEVTIVTIVTIFFIGESSKFHVKVFHESVVTKVSSGDVASTNYFLK